MEEYVGGVDGIWSSLLVSEDEIDPLVEMVSDVPTCIREEEEEEEEEEERSC